MSFEPGLVAETLKRLEADAAPPQSYIVAFSGGLDSTVLLQALAETRDTHRVALHAVHVDHALHADSGGWADHCRDTAAGLGVRFALERVKVPSTGGLGPEGAARRVRYAALERLAGPADWILTAHHRDDQAETLLLNLLRGSGPAGLAGIRPIRSAAAGWIARPLLEFSRAELLSWARGRELAWVDDPSNAASEVDRNYLRNQIIPALEQRWPDAGRRIARSAELCRESAGLLDSLAQQDLDAMAAYPGRLPVEALRKLPRARAANLLRFACRQGGQPPPPAARLASILDDLLTAREDASPVIAWPGAAARRFRGGLYLGSDDIEATFEGIRLEPGTTVDLGPGLGSLALEAEPGGGIAPERVAAGLVLRSRGGGESIRPRGDQHTRKLKKLLNEQGVLPWLRDKVPLLYAGDQLVAVGSFWIADEAWGEPGYRVRWIDPPANA